MSSSGRAARVTFLALLVLPALCSAALSRGNWAGFGELIMQNLQATPECQAHASKFNALMKDKTLTDAVLSERMWELLAAAKPCAKEAAVQPRVQVAAPTKPIDAAATPQAPAVVPSKRVEAAAPPAQSSPAPIHVSNAAEAPSPVTPIVAAPPPAPPVPTVGEVTTNAIAAASAQASAIAGSTLSAAAMHANGATHTFLGYAMLGLALGLSAAALFTVIFLSGVGVGFGYHGWRKRRAERLAPTVVEDDEPRSGGSRLDARPSQERPPAARPARKSGAVA